MFHIFVCVYAWCLCRTCLPFVAVLRTMFCHWNMTKLAIHSKMMSVAFHFIINFIVTRRCMYVTVMMTTKILAYTIQWTFCVYPCNFRIRSICAWRGGARYRKKYIMHIGKSLQRRALGLVIVRLDMLHVENFRISENEEQATSWHLRWKRTTIVSGDMSSLSSQVVYFFVVKCVVQVSLGHSG